MPKTILHVLPSLRQTDGGPIRIVLDLSARAEAIGLNSEVLGYSHPEIPDNPLRPAQIHGQPRLSRSWLRQNLDRFDGVVLHGMWEHKHSVMATMCRNAGVPYACFPHGMLERWAVYGQGPLKALKKKLYWYAKERRVFANARCVYFITQRERERSETTFSLNVNQRLLACYGVEAEMTPVTEPATKELLRLGDRKFALFLGRLHPKKNLDFLLTAWKQAQLPEAWHLVIAGSGDSKYTSEIRATIARQNLDRGVHMIGFVTGSDKSYLLQKAQWFLLPSLQENFGLAVVEAIDHGCAVAVSDQVFAGDFLDSETEILPLRLDDWLAFFRERMVDDEWRVTRATTDRQRLFEQLSMEKVVREWVRVLDETFPSRQRES